MATTRSQPITLETYGTEYHEEYMCSGRDGWDVLAARIPANPADHVQATVVCANFDK